MGASEALVPIAHDILTDKSKRVRPGRRCSSPPQILRSTLYAPRSLLLAPPTSGSWRLLVLRWRCDETRAAA